MQPVATAPLPPSMLSARRELEPLQGAWASVSGRHEVELLIAGNNFAVKYKHGPIYMGTLRLCPGQEPKGMDMLVQEGPERHQWKTALCIYEVDGDNLRWCPGEPGGRERLTEFPAEDDREFCCTRFRRERR